MPNLKKTTSRPWIPKPKGKRYKSHQSKEDNKVYHTRRWRRLRELVLQQEPLCRECKKRNVITPANVVNHIIRIADGGEAFALDNLQPLCTKCHNSKSGKEAHIKKKY